MYLIRGLLLAFLALQFLSCENEPLTGEFPISEQNDAEEGQFIAQIDGVEFIASSATATLTSDNELVVTGEKSGGEKIILKVLDAAVGTFGLTTGGSNQNAGKYYDGSINSSAYMSDADSGGSGRLNLTEINTEEETVTGTFNFLGVREKADSDGNPILDGNGNPELEDVEITGGAFKSIPYILGTGGGSGNPNDNFFAIVDGVDFIADNIRVTQPVLGDIHMIKVEARSTTGELLRIDVPRALGVGTFAMERISDGSKLTAIYNDGAGGENLTSNPGSITISQFDLELGILKATFNFTGTDPLNQVPDVVEVTEGRFTANFEGITGGNNSFTAKIDGIAYNPTEIRVLTTTINQYPRLIISTNQGDQKMEVSFPLTITEGTFDMEELDIVGDENVGSYTPVMGTSSNFFSHSGTLVITNYDIDNGTIDGTFNFTAKDNLGEDPTVYQITGGTFSIILP